VKVEVMYWTRSSVEVGVGPGKGFFLREGGLLSFLQDLQERLL
jgi:hypothetical protein